MKTVADLNALIPVIADKLSKHNHEIGKCVYERDEDGCARSDDPLINYFYYEEDGWSIEIVYECCGEWDYAPRDYWTPSSRTLLSAWGEISDITAIHYDEGTDEETEFNEDDLKELWTALDKTLEKIA